MSAYVKTINTCPRCKDQWIKHELWTPGTAPRYISGAGNGCAKCLHGRPTIKIEVIAIPDGLIFVWDEQQVEYNEAQ